MEWGSFLANRAKQLVPQERTGWYQLVPLAKRLVPGRPFWVPGTRVTRLTGYLAPWRGLPRGPWPIRGRSSRLWAAWCSPRRTSRKRGLHGGEAKAEGPSAAGRGAVGGRLHRGAEAGEGRAQVPHLLRWPVSTLVARRHPLELNACSRRPASSMMMTKSGRSTPASRRQCLLQRTPNEG